MRVVRISGLGALLLAAAILAPKAAMAQWETVGNGVEYRRFTMPDPNNVFVARMARSNLNLTIESSIAKGRQAGARETVPDQAARYDDAISYWGQQWGARNKVLVAVNGDFFNGTTGVPPGGQIHSGWYSKRYPNFGGTAGFVWTLNRDAFMGLCVTNRNNQQIITFLPSGSTLGITDVNRPRASGELILYTPQYDNTTLTDDTGVEVLVQMERPTMILPSPLMAKGTVRAVRNKQGSTPIPFDHIVLSATGSAATTLLSKATVGSQIGISQAIDSYESNCSTTRSLPWTKSFSAVGGNFLYLRDGVIQSTSNAGLIVKHPRTAIAYNDQYIFFIVCDGRDPGVSVGMTMAELGAFSKTYLNATYGMNMDGGGSSTMFVNGVVKNKPSDGTLRTVANGLMIVDVQPRENSVRAFTVGQKVTVAVSTPLRLGPGTNYGSVVTLSPPAEVTILDHALSGVKAKGLFWRKVSSPAGEGWVDESALAVKAASVSEAKGFVDGTRVLLPGCITSVDTGQAGPFTYVQQPDRAAGIRVTGLNAPRGRLLTLQGVLATEDGERVLTSASLMSVPATAPVPRPLWMAASALGGGPSALQPGLPNAAGPGNTGLLVRVFGQVAGAGAPPGSYLLSDGSGESLRVLAAPGASLPAVDSHVDVTGLSAMTLDQGVPRPVLRQRSPEDLTVH